MNPTFDPTESENRHSDDLASQVYFSTPQSSFGRARLVAENPELAVEHKKRVRKMASSIRGCERCALSRTCKSPVPGNIRLPGELEMVIVGEAPGRQEDAENRPFVGRSGKLIDEVLDTIGTSRRHVGAMNVVCCRPRGNADPEQEFIEACSVNFRSQLAVFNPLVVVLLGNFALHQIRGPGVGITSERGRPFWHSGRVFMPTFHPAYVLRNPKKKPYLVDDMGMALRIAREQDPPPSREDAAGVDLVVEGFGGQVVSY